MSEQAWTKAPIGLQRFGSEIMVVGKHSDRPIILNAVRMGMHGATIRVRDKGIMRPIAMGDETSHPDISRWFSCVNALDGIPNPAEFVRAARELAEAVNSVLSNSERFFAEQYVCGCGWCDENCKTPHTRATEALSAFRAAVEAVEGEKGAKQ